MTRQAVTQTTEVVQDESTNNLHLRGADREDGTATALCNRRYRVFTYEGDSQASLQTQYVTWNACDRCDAKAAR